MKRRTFLTLFSGSVLAPAGINYRQSQSATKMDELWLDLDHWLSEHLPEVLADLNSGCSSEQLSELEYRLDCNLPEDFKAFYRHHNGQKGNTTGLFLGLEFLDTDNIYSEWLAWRDLALEDEELATAIESESFPQDAIKTLYINLKWIPIARDWTGNHLGIDLDPGPTGTFGQVINFGADEDRKFVLAPSLTGFIAWMLDQYQSGNYQANERSLALQDPPNQHFLDVVPLVFGGN
ncbi:MULTISPECIES: SMI1/KNR4 family protein [Trichocoleus]|uniref:SMI1/KNR4 family protein n=1 Tax=Trichocoleus desertorum GB2-A4 TaxID=2933944 RepID=A0ABV0J350_9CYAN|nr:SMI1/KNR4 family protein [Trichocoleus sp. FACHB-46]MBD1860113.1 SMI1/KNR4 family protein [Trichocoleus sp. FACHB-46]